MTLNEKDLEKVLRHLRRLPSDYAGAAKKVGLKRGDLKLYFEQNPTPLEELQEEYLDSLETLVTLHAQGSPLPESINGHPVSVKSFNPVQALKVLERMRPVFWSGSVDGRAKARRYAADRVRELEELNRDDSVSAVRSAAKASAAEHMLRLEQKKIKIGVVK